MDYYNQNKIQSNHNLDGFLLIGNPQIFFIPFPTKDLATLANYLKKYPLVISDVRESAISFSLDSYI